MEKPDVVQHLIKIGFTELIGEWKPIWGQGDGFYWLGKLVNKSGDTVFTDRDTTNYKYSLNGTVMPEKFFLSLEKDFVGSNINAKLLDLYSKSYMPKEILIILGFCDNLQEAIDYFTKLIVTR